MQDWTDPAWLASVTAWIEDRLAENGASITGPVEQPHLYFWSTALRVPTSSGVMWCKAMHPDGAFEARLAPDLAAGHPDVLAAVVAADPDRGWLLTRDAGVRLRDAEEFSVRRWCDVLARYAQLQLDLAPHASGQLALGVPDLRPASLPELLRAAVDSPLLQAGGVAELDPPTTAAVDRALPVFDALCAQLADSPVPVSLQHDDLHDGNVFVDGPRLTFLDWGDACLTHPFHTLTVTTRSLAHRHSLPPGGPEITRLVDAYLEPWTAVTDRPTLLADADAARRTGVVQRALSWFRLVAAMPDHVAREHGDTVPYGLRLFLLDAPYGAWDDGTVD
ncbi:MAG TPA: phosphotransferase [Mycobacteriales bacterium]|nr:phosphotransferase [Mycobacteriales bacterium]